MHENKMGSAPFSVAAPGSASSVFPAKSEWLTATEAAQYLKVKPRSLLLWVREGKVPAYALSGTERRVWRFRREDLDNSLLSRPVVTSETPAVLAHKRRL
jgi:excisionase family DNA binding protein